MEESGPCDVSLILACLARNSLGGVNEGWYEKSRIFIFFKDGGYIHVDSSRM